MAWKNFQFMHQSKITQVPLIINNQTLEVTLAKWLNGLDLQCSPSTVWRQFSGRDIYTSLSWHLNPANYAMHSLSSAVEVTLESNVKVIREN